MRASLKMIDFGGKMDQNINNGGDGNTQTDFPVLVLLDPSCMKLNGLRSDSAGGRGNITRV